MNTINQTGSSTATKTIIITLIEATRIGNIVASLVTHIITDLQDEVSESMISKISQDSMSMSSSR